MCLLYMPRVTMLLFILYLKYEKTFSRLLLFYCLVIKSDCRNEYYKCIFQVCLLNFIIYERHTLYA